MFDSLKDVFSRYGKGRFDKDIEAPDRSSARLQPPSDIAFKNITIAICNQKGGCSKTTTAINLSSCLAERGYKVLLLDLDSQAHASLGLGVDIDASSRSVYDVLINNAELQDVIQRTSVKNLDIAAANSSLADAQLELAAVLGRETVLRIALHKLHLQKEYDFIFIDCSPSLNLVTINALVAADFVLIPVQTHYYSLEGMKELFGTIDIVKERLNHDIKILGILATLFDKRTKVAREVLAQIREYFQELVFRSVIHYNVKLCEAPIYKKPIHLYARASRGAQDYHSLTDEVVRLTRKEAACSSENVTHYILSEETGATSQTAT